MRVSKSLVCRLFFTQKQSKKADTPKRYFHTDFGMKIWKSYPDHIQTISKPYPNYIQTISKIVSKSYPNRIQNHIQTVSKSYPNRIQIHIQTISKPYPNHIHIISSSRSYVYTFTDALYDKRTYLCIYLPMYLPTYIFPSKKKVKSTTGVALS